MTAKTHDEAESRLLDVGLSHFQTIGEYVCFPFGKLTLLFGPNSAGKSAVADALDVASSIWAGRRRRVNWLSSVWEGVEALQKRHWRVGDASESDAFFPHRGRDVRIDLRVRLQQFHETPSFPVHRQAAQFFPTLYRRLSWKREASPIEVLARITLSEEADEDIENHSVDLLCLSLEVDGQPIVRVKVSEFGASSAFGADTRHQLAVNLQHPLVQPDEATVFDFEFAAEAEDSPFRLEEGWLKFIRGWQLGEGNALWLETAEVWPDRAENEALKFKALWDFLFQDIGGTVAAIARMARVPASRNVPSPDKLTFLYADELARVLPLPSITLESDERYRELARQLAVRRWSMDMHADGEGPTDAVPTELSSPLWINGKKVDLPEFINRMLSGPLFMDKGYQVTCEVFELKGGRSGRHRASLAQLGLRDATGRSFDFADVGSGIGYVLPVLVEGYQSAQSFVEQPELHLHPALQSRLGDVLIEMANEGRFLIVETHSEHMLLRMLRRVRQTTKGTVDPTLRLSPTDLVCLYFDPSTNGPTRVRQLRVTPSGDFMDRWPAGFFDSRDEDLFDE